MYEISNGYLQSWTDDRRRELVLASRTASQMKAARPGDRPIGWTQRALAQIGAKLIAAGQRLQQPNGDYQVASQ